LGWARELDLPLMATAAPGGRGARVIAGRGLREFYLPNLGDRHTETLTSEQVRELLCKVRVRNRQSNPIPLPQMFDLDLKGVSVVSFCGRMLDTD
jgi:hypothetical protein